MASRLGYVRHLGPRSDSAAKPSDMRHLIALANCCQVPNFQTLGGTAPVAELRLFKVGLG